MNKKQPWIERRRDPRVHERGELVLRAMSREIHGRIVAISRTFLEMKCQLGFTFRWPVGTHVEIELRLAEDDRRFVSHGRVMCVRAGSRHVVIAIDSMPEALAKRVEQDEADQPASAAQRSEEREELAEQLASSTWDDEGGATKRT